MCQNHHKNRRFSSIFSKLTNGSHLVFGTSNGLPKPTKIMQTSICQRGCWKKPLQKTKAKCPKITPKSKELPRTVITLERPTNCQNQKSNKRKAKQSIKNTNKPRKVPLEKKKHKMMKQIIQKVKNCYRATWPLLSTF